MSDMGREGAIGEAIRELRTVGYEAYPAILRKMLESSEKDRLNLAEEFAAELRKRGHWAGSHDVGCRSCNLLRRWEAIAEEKA